MTTLDIIKMDNFIFHTTNNVYDTIPLTTSKNLQKFLVDENGKEVKLHKNIMQDIRQSLKDIAGLNEYYLAEDIGQMAEYGRIARLKSQPTSETPRAVCVCIESTYKDVQNKTCTQYLINKNMLLLVLMKYSTKNVMRAKAKMLIMIEEAERIAAIRLREREDGKQARHILQNTFNKAFGHMEDRNARSYNEAMFTNQIYGALFNKTAFEIKGVRTENKHEIARDLLTNHELNLVKYAENQISTLSNFFSLDKAFSMTIENMKKDNKIPVEIV